MNDQHLDTHPDLFGLLRGELTNAEVVLVGAHLDECDVCHASLREVAVGHALLTGATRTLTPAAAERRSDEESTPAPLPALPRPAPERRWLRPVAAVAAAAVLVGGSAAVTSYLQRPDRSDVVVAQQSAVLEPVEGAGSGRVLMASHENAVDMKVETRDLPPLGKGEFYYVWLFNPKTEKMLALGVVGPSGQADFSIPDSLVGKYQVVDVSLEKDDGDPAHSITSVLRASYADSGTAQS